jgi:predicted glycoside hydrolase/deacetylase ChbG (UPF0249 family)
MTTPRRICICVDDYGLHPAVDDAVLQLLELGRVSATSCIVGGPAWPQEGPRLRQAAADGRLDAGLHLDLGEFTFDTALLKPVSWWIVDSVLRNVDADRVRAEIRAQLDRFESVMGLAPSHIDGHQHVHQFPVVRDVLLEELERRYGPGHRPWLRCTVGAARGGFKGRVIEAMGGRALRAIARERGFAQNRELLGIYPLHGNAQRYTALMQGWLREADDGDLLVCHVANAAVPGDGIAGARVTEWEVFAQDDFGRMLANAGVTLAPMSTIVNG